MRNHSNNIKYKQAVILGFALLFLLFAGHAFADCITSCTDEDFDQYTPDIDCNDDPTCTSCKCGDCNDTNSQTYPGATEICDGQDNDCNDIIDDEELDLDNDGFMICNDDCNDTNPNTYPGATEICDGQDNDCNDIIDDEELDLDDDGFMICNGDCNDTVASINPDAPEICNNTIDDDCDGAIDCADKDCKNDPACASQPCAPEGDACENTEECCDELKCKKQIDSPTQQRICCSKDECAAANGCVVENICIATTITPQKVCAHGTWIPRSVIEHNCNDEIDNDCDGPIDCDDGDCKHRPTCLNTKCTADEDCKGYQTCKNGICRLLICKGCAHPEDHTCQKWECCGKKDCGSGEMCWKHECIEAPENSATKKKYIKENARSYIDEAEQKILDKKNIKPAAGEIKTLEKKLNRAKSAYSRGRYEEAESLATETITGYKQRKTIIENINAFLYKIKSFFVREKKSEPEKQYASESDFALQ